MKFRKKPVVIEAFRIGLEVPPAWFLKFGNVRIELSAQLDDEYGYPITTAYIGTLEGVMTANHGDWIIKGVKDEVYPCKPDIFEAIYERVSDKNT